MHRRRPRRRRRRYHHALSRTGRDKLLPTDAPFTGRCSRADCFGRAGQYEAAAAAFTSALRLDSSNAMCWYGRGTAHKLLGQHRDALADAERAANLGHEPGKQLL
jgi:tetratricopeptide (TPR) repeat protein